MKFMESSMTQPHLADFVETWCTGAVWVIEICEEVEIIFRSNPRWRMASKIGSGKFAVNQSLILHFAEILYMCTLWLCRGHCTSDEIKDGERWKSGYI